MKIGLLFGSFNPIHIGHVAIAHYMVEQAGLGQVWLVVSPHNPMKDKKSLADARKRLTHVKKAIGRNSRIKVSDIEFKLPQPSYTIAALEILRKKFPRYKFILIIGEDNLTGFHKWKNYDKILRDFRVVVYPRVNSGRKKIAHRNIRLLKAPLLDVSSTRIREMKKQGKDIRKFLV